MSIRNIMWTALPNGLTKAGDRLQLSVLVSPRLITNTGTTGLLNEFPDFLDWPQTVLGLTFKVEIQGGPTFNVTLPPAAKGALDSPAWVAMFHKDTGVTSYAFDDKSGLNVLSYPTKKVLSFVKQQYQTIAVNSATDKPTLQDLGLADDSRRKGLGQIAICLLYTSDAADE